MDGTQEPAFRLAGMLGRKTEVFKHIPLPNMISPDGRKDFRKHPRSTCLLIFALLFLGYSSFSCEVSAYQSEAESFLRASQKSSEGKAERANPALPRIALGSQDGTPGVEVIVPLYYSPPRGVETRSLAVEIEWISQNLQFVRFARGISAESIGADVSGKVTETRRDSKNIEHSNLRIEASVVEQDPKRGIPEGLVAYLTFKISPEAKPFTIELRPKLLSARFIGTPGQTFTQAETESGKVTVELPGLPPYVTCFFFTH